MKRHFLIIGILLVLLGLVMLFAPKGFINALVVCVGIIAIVDGIINLISVRNLIDDTDFKKAFTLRAILNIIIGLAAVIVPVFFAGLVWTVIIYVLAAQLVISAGIEIYGVWKMNKAGISYSAYLFEAIVSILLAMVLFAIPAAIGLTLIRLIGILIIVAGIAIAAWGLQAEKRNSHIEKMLKSDDD